MLRKCRYKIFFTAVVWALLNLSGCSNNQYIEKHAFISWQDNYSKLNNLTFFKNSGRLGIFTQGRRDGAAYDFEGLSGGYLLVIKSPLGNSLASATVTENTLALNIGDKSYRDDYAALMFEQAFGFAIPVDKLKPILLGIPQGKRVFDNEGRIVKAQWDGYSISYSGIMQSDGLRIPKAVTVNHGDYTIKTSVSSFVLKGHDHENQ